MLLSTLADAHELPTSTARVSLRDLALEVSAEIDPLPLLAQIQKADLASLREEELVSLLARAKEVLETETRLLADGQRVDLMLTIGIEPSEVRSLLALSPEARHTHAHLVPIRWEAKEPLAAAKQLSLALPTALGPVLISFVQPQSRYAMPGSAASFSVLEKPASTAPPEAPAKGRWAEGAVVLAFIAIVLNIVHDARKPSATAR